MKKIIPTCGLDKILRIESIRRLPGLSGITSCFSLKTYTNPGESPLGEASQWPDLSDVDNTRKEI